MAEVIFVQGDTAPPVIGQIVTADGTPRDLSDVAEVRFQLRRDNGTKYMVNAVAEITDAATGMVRYQWAANDLSVPGGDYIAQWQLTYDSTPVENGSGTWTVAVASNVVTVQTGVAHGLRPADTFSTNADWTVNTFMANLSTKTVLSATTTSFTFTLTQADQPATEETDTSASIIAAGKVQTTTPANTVEIRRQ